MAIADDTSYELTGYQVKDLAQKIRAKVDSNSLAPLAFSGLYSDITGAPTIPTVYNGTLTIQQDGVTLGTFSANQGTNETVNILGQGGYSTTEAATALTWVDGLVIYKKTLVLNGDSGSVAHGISSLNEVVKIEGILMMYNLGEEPDELIYAGSIPVPYYNAASQVNISVDAETQSVLVESYGSPTYADAKTYITLYYTKSS